MRIQDEIYIYVDDAVGNLNQAIYSKSDLTWSDTCSFTKRVLMGESFNQFVKNSKTLWIKELSELYCIEGKKILKIVNLILKSMYNPYHADAVGVFCDVRLEWGIREIL